MDENSDNFGSKVSKSFKSGTRPKFLGGKSDGGDAPAGLNVDEKKTGAANKLSEAEKNAASLGLDQAADNIAETRETENTAKGFYSGNGREQSERGQEKPKPSGFMGIVGRGGPLYALIFTIFIAGGIMGGTQLFQPFSLVAQFAETFNSMHTSANVRSERFFKMQMDSGRTKSPYNLFGTKFKLSNRQINKLAAQGIEYDDDYEGSGTRVLKYTDSDGNIRVVTADTDAAKRIGGDAVDFKTFYHENSDFFSRYNAGSMTWRGAIANWFGTMTGRFLESNNLTRNMFDNFKDKVAESGGDSEKALKDILKSRTEEMDDGGFSSKEATEKEEVDGEETTKDVNTRDINPSETPNRPVSDYGEKDSGSSSSGRQPTVMDASGVRAKLDDISGKVQKGANIACTVGNVIGAVSMLVTAAEALQIINLTTAYFETVDKVKAGDGDDAPIHELTGALNEKKTSTNKTLEYTDGYSASGANDNSSNINESGVEALTTKDNISENKSAMQSSGIASLYGGGAINPHDPSVASFNFTSNIKRILGGIGVSMAGFETCAVAKMVSNGVSAVVSGIEIAGCILAVAGAVFTFGMSAAGCAPLVGKIAKGIAFSVAIGVTIAAVISTITPLVTNVLTRDLVSGLGGENLGNALTSGGNMYLGNTHRANGGSLANVKKYEEFAMAQQQVIAENAKYERSTLSPFDLTSKYTFMGTIMTQMMGFLTTNSLMSTIVTTNSTISSSIVAMSPTASAYNLVETLPNMNEDASDYYGNTCPYLASIGAVGDAYCNPYSITDMSTIGMDPADVIDHLAASNSFLDGETSDGNVKINGKSDLAKYIQFCDNRQSAFGIADTNIVNAVSDWGNVNTESSTFNTVANSAIGAVPVIGDIIDIGSNAQALANVGYVSGESCVAGNGYSIDVQNGNTGGGEEWSAWGDDETNNANQNKAPNWSTAKYYQRFIEDQALAESMGLIEESAVTAYLNEYYEQNPLDNSYEGILARKSGLSKDTVVAILDLVEYGNYIANYNPAERYAFGAPVVEENNAMNFDNEYKLSSAPILLHEIVYADVRNRNFVV